MRRGVIYESFHIQVLASRPARWVSTESSSYTNKIKHQNTIRIRIQFKKIHNVRNICIIIGVY